MAYQLSVSIFGPGISEPAHWGFVIHQPPNDSGELLHVRVIDVPMNIFQFEPRVPHLLDSQGAYGLCKIADLDGAQRFKVASILEREVPAPRGGMKNCQDWVLDGLVALEVEELVADGTTAIWTSRVGKRTDVIKREAGRDWHSLNNR
ncbi:hypothetical protein ARAM_000195 [Aspergillus rambellii]|uniref:Uncharacterized protein n=3 Tax=Aspergillus subgen. Nidulantes TaxID=2720870 RepID=A0A0F8WSF8_9EURO|nr:hypothetical protein AOCH_007115 [Aspergillus ochraceoroseus]KKK20600.1 hypothetical protein ARAM_000195 [Aspergillus rambellii]